MCVYVYTYIYRQRRILLLLCVDSICSKLGIFSNPSNPTTSPFAENMRREGFELSVSPPRVVLREEDGVKLEPMEEVVCEVLDEHAGEVIEVLNNRKGEVSNRRELGVDRTLKPIPFGLLKP